MDTIRRGVRGLNTALQAAEKQHHEGKGVALMAPVHSAHRQKRTAIVVIVRIVTDLSLFIQDPLTR